MAAKEKITYVEEKVKIESLDDHVYLADKKTFSPLHDFILKEFRWLIVKELTLKQFVVFILLEYGFSQKEIADTLEWKIKSVYGITYSINKIREKVRKTLYN